MTHPASGNPTWQDYPDITTLVTAAGLESIESTLDAHKTALTKNIASYVPSAVQSIPNAAATNLLFGTASLTTTAVTRATSGAGHVFTLTRAGLWIVLAYCRLQAGGTTAYCGLNLTTSAAGHALVSNAQFTNQICILTATVPIMAAANDTVSVNMYQERGSAVSTLDTATGIRMAWIG